jgi:hypothetical protein
MDAAGFSETSVTTDRHCVTSQKTWNLFKTAVRNWMRPRSNQYCLLANVIYTVMFCCMSSLMAFTVIRFSGSCFGMRGPVFRYICCSVSEEPATLSVAYTSPWGTSMKHRSATGGRFIATEREACIRRSIRAVLMANWLAGVGAASCGSKADSLLWDSRKRRDDRKRHVSARLYLEEDVAEWFICRLCFSFFVPPSSVANSPVSDMAYDRRRRLIKTHVSPFVWIIHFHVWFSIWLAYRDCFISVYPLWTC